MKKYLICLIGVVFVSTFFLYRIGGFGLFDFDEAVYAETSREMLETGDFINPRYNYMPFYEKPILFYWLTCISYRIFGINEFSTRVVSSVSCIVLVFLTYYFGKILINKRAGMLAAIILTTNTGIIIISKAAIMDGLLTLFISSSLYCFLAGYITGNKSFYWGFYISSALAVMTKGIVGIVIPAAVVVWFILVRKQNIREIKLVPGIAIFLLISLPWYIVVTVISKGSFFNDFLIHHNIQRFSQPFTGHSGSILYYIPVILIGLFPWSAFLPGSIRNSIKQRGPVHLFLLMWVVVPTALFSISQTKLPSYIIPVFPAFALIGGVYFDKKFSFSKGEGYKFNTESKICWSIFFVLVLLMSLVFAMNGFLIDKAKANFLEDAPYLNQFIDFGLAPLILAAILLVSSAVLYFFLRYKNIRAVFGVFVVLMVIFNFMFMTYIMPSAWKYMQGCLYHFSNIVRAESGDGDKLIGYDVCQPSILFYTRKKMIACSKNDLERIKNELNHASNTSNVYVITKQSLFQKLSEAVHSQVIRRCSGYTLLKGQPANDNENPP